MAVINRNSICTWCRKEPTCYYEKFLRKDCPYFMELRPEEINVKHLCRVCGHPTIPTGYCRSCPLCGESTGCA